MLKRKITSNINNRIINIILTQHYGTIIGGLSFDKYPINQKIDPNDLNIQEENFKKSIVFLHGILGNKKNWRTPSNIFVKNHPEYQGIAIDHRGHGKSNNKELTRTTASKDTTHSVYSCVLDLIETFEINKIKPTILCGHSFSGKVVLSYLETILKLEKNNIAYKNLLPEHVWILDSIPGPYNFALDQSQQQESVVHIMNTLSNIPDEFESIEAAAQLLTNQGVSKPIVQWLTSSIVSTATNAYTNAATSTSTTNSDVSYSASPVTPIIKYRFAFNKLIVQELFHDFCQLNMWNFLENYHNPNIKIHFIRSGKNPAWNNEVLEHFQKITHIDKSSKKSRNIYLHTMSHVGHWLHAEDVHGMLQIITTNSK